LVDRRADAAAINAMASRGKNPCHSPDRNISIIVSLYQRVEFLLHFQRSVVDWVMLCHDVIPFSFRLWKFCRSGETSKLADVA
jgi:hypothetical protein